MRIFLSILPLAGFAAASNHLDTLSSSVHRRAATTALRCTNGFSINADKTECICREGKVISVDGSKCLDNCTSGSYKVGDGTCAACPAPFAKCSSPTVATGCLDVSYLSGTTCVEVCPLGTWTDFSSGKNRCRDCSDKDAASCTDNGKTATACLTNYLFNGKCIEAKWVPDGFFAGADTHTVEACDGGVKTCIGLGRGKATSCGKNKKKDQLVLTPKGTCELHCPSGYYANKTLATCIPCDSSALTCDINGANTCAKDSAGTQLLLTPTRRCVLPWTGPTGYWPDFDSKTFKACDDGVTSCVGNGAGKAVTCGKRVDGTALYWSTPTSHNTTDSASNNSTTGNLSPANSTIIIPPATNSTLTNTTFANSTTTPSSSTNTSTVVYRRERRHVQVIVETGTCVEASACPAETWPDAATSTCAACDSDESACSGNGSGSAISCKRGLYLSASHDCLTHDDCKASGAYYPDDGESTSPSRAHHMSSSCVLALADTATCSTCDPGELACTDNGLGFATACGKNDNGDQLYLYDGDWQVSSSPTNSCQRCDTGALACTGHSEATLCGISLGLQRLYLNVDGMCVEEASCDSSTWADPATGTCASCKLIDEDASTCTSPTTFTCATKFFSDSACVEACPYGSFGNSTTHLCSPCLDSDAATCDPTGLATSCQTKNLFNGACFAACPVGTFEADGVCSPCESRFPDAKECSASTALSCKTKSLSNQLCVDLEC
ncbi:hypothetical protein JCM11641_004839 [Rhodosporidiobolus odoratus]